MKKISCGLWYANEAEEAANLYLSLFRRGKIGSIARYTKTGAEMANRPEGSVLTVEFELENQRIVALNGGPLFPFTPAFSFLVHCESAAELDRLWKGLSETGSVKMPLDTYPWANRYGWTADRFGLNWQLLFDEKKKTKQKIVPAMLLTGHRFGKGDEALQFYRSLFPGSKILAMNREETTDTIRSCTFTLFDEHLALMEGDAKPGYDFNESFSLIVSCDSQNEIDRYWDELVREGTPSECGWLRDKYGAAWQIVPKDLGKWVADPKRGENVMQALRGMTKLDYDRLENAYLFPRGRPNADRELSESSSTPASPGRPGGRREPYRRPSSPSSSG